VERLVIPKLLQNTPVEHWPYRISAKLLLGADYPQTLQIVLQLAALYKYGGAVVHPQLTQLHPRREEWIAGSDCTPTILSEGGLLGLSLEQSTLQSLLQRFVQTFSRGSTTPTSPTTDWDLILDHVLQDCFPFVELPYNTTDRPSSKRPSSKRHYGIASTPSNSILSSLVSLQYLFYVDTLVVDPGSSSTTKTRRHKESSTLVWNEHQFQTLPSTEQDSEDSSTLDERFILALRPQCGAPVSATTKNTIFILHNTTSPTNPLEDTRTLTSLLVPREYQEHIQHITIVPSTGPDTVLQDSLQVWQLLCRISSHAKVVLTSDRVYALAAASLHVPVLWTGAMTDVSHNINNKYDSLFHSTWQDVDHSRSQQHVLLGWQRRINVLIYCQEPILADAAVTFGLVNLSLARRLTPPSTEGTQGLPIVAISLPDRPSKFLQPDSVQLPTLANSVAFTHAEPLELHLQVSVMWTPRQQCLVRHLLGRPLHPESRIIITTKNIISQHADKAIYIIPSVSSLVIGRLDSSNSTTPVVLDYASLISSSKYLRLWRMLNMTVETALSLPFRQLQEHE
jgi:hypothetical protein